MIIRDQIDDKVIITNQIETNWWETNIYGLNNDGEMSLWIHRSDSHAKSQAISKHEAYATYERAEIQKCKYCDQVARNYDGVMKEWLCSHHFNLYIKERA